MAALEWFDTTDLCDAFGVDGACSMLVDTTPCNTHNFTGGMMGHKHSEETKEKMRQSAQGRDMSKVVEASIKSCKGKPAHNKGAQYPHLWKEGTLIKDDKVYHIKGIGEFCKENNLNPSHIGQVLSGKRKSHKGFHKHK